MIWKIIPIVASLIILSIVVLFSRKHPVYVPPHLPREIEISTDPLSEGAFDEFDAVELEIQLYRQLHQRAHYQVSINDWEIIGTCSVCNLSISSSEEALACPICNNPAHPSHLKEWVKIKGFCPRCEAIIKIPSSSDVEILENLELEKDEEVNLVRKNPSSPKFIKEFRKVLKDKVKYWESPKGVKGISGMGSAVGIVLLITALLYIVCKFIF